MNLDKMIIFIKADETILKEKYSSYVLGGDIGGTNTNLVVAGVKNSKPNLLFSLNIKSNNLDSLIPAIEKIITYARSNYGIELNIACIGAAGVVSPSNDFAQLTNVSWNVSTKELIDNTSLESVYVINDFQTIGYGLNLLDHNNENDIFQVRAGNRNLEYLTFTKAIIGAGTGLGKSILTYDKQFKAYIPIPSEGGHGDFPAQNDFETQLVNFIKKLRGISNPLNYEEVLSGRGLESIYLFIRNTQNLRDTQYTEEIDKSSDKAPLISKYKNIDESCKETLRLFTRFYARCAKNFALDTLAYGGMYIAGGIASKNKEIFTTMEFTDEFENAYRRNDFLKNIPINIIVNYDVSLYGACYAAIYKSYSKI